MNAIILGLDVSTNCTGWCALPLNSSNLIKDGSWGKIITEWDGIPHPANLAEDFWEKVDRLLAALDEVIAGLNAKGLSIVACGMEQLNYFRGGAVTRDLIGIQRIVAFHLLKKYKIDVNEMNTTHVKSVFVKGLPKEAPGVSSKIAVLNAMNFRFGTNFKFISSQKDHKSVQGVSIGFHQSDDDITDAGAVAWVLREEIGAELILALDKGNAIN